MSSVRVRALRVFPFLGLSGVLIALGCAINPVSGSREVVLTSVEEEKRVGKEASQQVEAMMGLVPESELTRYVSQLGERLAAHSPRQDIGYEFAVVDMKEPNAFALPGGYVYVSRGLLLLANTEAALAGAVGHEIGHAAARHSVQRQTRAAPLAILSGITSGVVGIVLPSVGQGLGKVGALANSAALAPYGRDQEREADRVGQELAADAGWAPAGLADLLDSLGRENALHKDRRAGPSFLSTHPSSAERVANTLSHAASLQRADTLPLSKTRVEFLARLDGLVVGEGAAGGVFVDETHFMQPEMDFKLRFPTGWEVQNGPAFVGALAPEEDAAMVAELEDKRGGPLEVGKKTLVQEGLPLGEVEALTIGGMPAARASGIANDRWVELTWIENGDNLFRITGVAKEKRRDSYRPIFTTVSDSFAKLKDEDREKVRETRVRIHPAIGGESVAELVERLAADGEPEFVAVVNGIDVDERLEAGQLVKVPISEPYSSAP